jgi:hypothetical protein
LNAIENTLRRTIQRQKQPQISRKRAASNRRRIVSDNTERAGLGKVIYNVDESKETEKPSNKKSNKKVDNAEVQEADEESFPASDPPGYAGGSSSESS